MQRVGPHTAHFYPQALHFRRRLVSCLTLQSGDFGDDRSLSRDKRGKAMIERYLLCTIFFYSLTATTLAAQEPVQLSGPKISEKAAVASIEEPTAEGAFVLSELKRQIGFGRPSQAGLLAVAEWLSKRFDLPTPQTMPQVEIVAPERMAAPRHQGFDSQASPGSETVALYVHTTHTIFLLEGWDASSPTDLSVLVHEMVHHMQSVGHLKFACSEERERLAFAAQASWLEQFGLTLEGEFQLDPFTLLVRTNCLG
jgi:hypothetical protein